MVKFEATISRVRPTEWVEFFLALSMTFPSPPFPSICMHLSAGCRKLGPYKHDSLMSLLIICLY